jgi:GMP synthase PP-ATPase subunit
LEFLGGAAMRIINELRGINAVVYDLTANPRARRSGSRG